MQFDRFLAPDTANRQGFCVQQAPVGGVANMGTDQCLTAGSGMGSVTISVEYDPVDRVVVLKPKQPLAVGRYNVRLLPPKNDTDTTGIRAFDGVPLAKEVSFAFTVDANAQADEPDRTIDYCSAETACLNDTNPPAHVQDQNSVDEYMAQSCASEGSCHAPWNSVKPPTILIGAALLLDDGPDGGGVPGALGRIARERLVAPETATDPDPGTPRTSGQDSFARNMPFIDPQNPGNSFILYKMIIGMLHCPANNAKDAIDDTNCTGSDGGYGIRTRFQHDIYAQTDAGACAADAGTIIHYAGDRIPYAGRSLDKLGAWVPEEEWNPPAVGEYERLRYRIRGNPMPSPAGGEGPRNIHMISAWIAAGALARPCP